MLSNKIYSKIKLKEYESLKKNTTKQLHKTPYLIINPCLEA